jgi:hypothetical protein
MKSTVSVWTPNGVTTSTTNQAENGHGTELNECKDVDRHNASTNASGTIHAGLAECVHQQIVCKPHPTNPTIHPSMHVYSEGRKRHTNMFNNIRSAHRSEDKPNAPPHMHPRTHL